MPHASFTLPAMLLRQGWPGSDAGVHLSRPISLCGPSHGIIAQSTMALPSSLSTRTLSLNCLCDLGFTLLSSLLLFFPPHLRPTLFLSALTVVAKWNLHRECIIFCLLPCGVGVCCYSGLFAGNGASSRVYTGREWSGRARFFKVMNFSSVSKAPIRGCRIFQAIVSRGNGHICRIEIDSLSDIGT